MRAGTASVAFPAAPGSADGGRILSRRALDQALIDAARCEGAEFCDESCAMDVTIREDCVGVSIRNCDALRLALARVVIVADGLAGRLLDGLMGRRMVRRRGAIGVGAVLQPDASEIRSGVIELAMGMGGYLGLTRLETGEVDVAAALNPRYVRAHGGVCETLGSIVEHCGVKLAGLRSAPWKGTPTMASRRRSVAARRIFVGRRRGELSRTGHWRRDGLGVGDRRGRRAIG